MSMLLVESESGCVSHVVRARETEWSGRRIQWAEIRFGDKSDRMDRLGGIGDKSIGHRSYRG